jgi:multidrug efflux system membrane fusion protein
MASRRPRWGFAVLGVLAVAIAAWAILGPKKKAKAERAPVVPVATARATVQDMPLTISEIGAAQAWASVTIKSQVNGKLLAVPVREGSDVRKGQVLAQIDPSQYESAVLQAQGALKRDQALLDAARVDLERYRVLLSQDSASKQQFDTQTALVKQDEGLVLIDQGQLKGAQVNLMHCRITSPVDGRVGVRLVDAGNIISTGDTTGILTVNQITPIAVTFTVPQGDFQRLVQASGGFSRPMRTEAYSQEDGKLLDTGAVSIADNHVDPSTGTVQMKANFPNGSRRLWPGQFVDVRLTLQVLERALTVPAAAVNQGPKGAYVYVVGTDGRAIERPVTVEAAEQGVAIITRGLEAGEIVVTDGQMSLAPGSKVRVHGGPSPPGTRRGE